MEQADLGLVEQTVRGIAAITVTVEFSRVPGRAKCSRCGVRRILYSMAVVGLVQGSARCGKCMGLR